MSSHKAEALKKKMSKDTKGKGAVEYKAGAKCKACGK
jgi:hypothetical protein